MASFAYDAINSQGIEISGVIHAPDLGAAREHMPWLPASACPDRIGLFQGRQEGVIAR